MIASSIVISRSDGLRIEARFSGIPEDRFLKYSELHLIDLVASEVTNWLAPCGHEETVGDLKRRLERIAQGTTSTVRAEFAIAWKRPDGDRPGGEGTPEPQDAATPGPRLQGTPMPGEAPGERHYWPARSGGDIAPPGPPISAADIGDDPGPIYPGSGAISDADNPGVPGDIGRRYRHDPDDRRGDIGRR